MLDNMRQYLSELDIPKDKKQYSMSFCKKIKYLDELHNAAIQDTKEKVDTGFGNVNSKICFIFKDKNSFNILKPLVQSILDSFDVNAWNVYITFVDKTSNEYNKKYAFLINEIHAVGTHIFYVFDKDDNVYNDIISFFNTRNVSLPEKHFFIDIQKLASSDIEIRKELWNSFKYLINYKEIE